LNRFCREISIANQNFNMPDVPALPAARAVSWKFSKLRLQALPWRREGAKTDLAF
jgi:hypothetical protein